jgi:hypothetical protein
VGEGFLLEAATKLEWPCGTGDVGHTGGAHNKPEPFIWTGTAEDILAKVARGWVALEAVNQD